MYSYGLTITPLSIEAVKHTTIDCLSNILKDIEKLGYGSMEWTTVAYEIKKQNGALHSHSLYHCHKKPWFNKIVKMNKEYQIYIQILVTDSDQTNFRNYCIKEHNPFVWKDYPPGCTKMPGWGLDGSAGPFPLQTHYIKSQYSFIKGPTDGALPSTPVRG